MQHTNLSSTQDLTYDVTYPPQTIPRTANCSQDDHVSVCVYFECNIWTATTHVRAVKLDPHHILLIWTLAAVAACLLSQGRRLFRLRSKPGIREDRICSAKGPCVLASARIAAYMVHFVCLSRLIAVLGFCR